MPIRKAFLLALFLFIVLTLSWFLFFLKWRESVERYEAPAQEQQEPGSSSMYHMPGGDQPPTRSDGLPRPHLESTGFDFSELGLQAHAAAVNGPALEALRTELEALALDEALAQLLAWLEAGIDLPTGIWFELAAKGKLVGAPSFRTFAIDQLARMSPELAAEYAQAAFRRELPDFADEFALQLRNFGRYALDRDPSAPEQLETQMQRLILKADWVQAPGVGFLEAFDTWVALESTAALPTLTEWLGHGPQDPVLGHAAYLTLERLIDRSGAETFSELAVWTETPLRGDPAKRRAALWARAPLEQPEGVQLAEVYLLNPALTPAERRAFYAQVPNLHFSHSHNLLSEGVYPDAATILSRLQASRDQLANWRQDSRFAADQAAIEEALQRLQGVLGQH
ncbi:MAG: hypothetical protein JJU20_09505 [Opitutales bacterium]|nr:hypothetical protein [Opitutales bacterium]